jgi:hypothetical protein
MSAVILEHASEHLLKTPGGLAAITYFLQDATKRAVSFATLHRLLVPFDSGTRFLSASAAKDR